MTLTKSFWGISSTEEDHTPFLSRVGTHHMTCLEHNRAADGRAKYVIDTKTLGVYSPRSAHYLLTPQNQNKGYQRVFLKEEHSTHLNMSASIMSRNIDDILESLGGGYSAMKKWTERNPLIRGFRHTEYGFRVLSSYPVMDLEDMGALRCPVQGQTSSILKDIDKNLGSLWCRWEDKEGYDYVVECMDHMRGNVLDRAMRRMDQCVGSISVSYRKSTLEKFREAVRKGVMVDCIPEILSAFIPESLGLIGHCNRHLKVNLKLVGDDFGFIASIEFKGVPVMLCQQLGSIQHRLLLDAWGFKSLLNIRPFKCATGWTDPLSWVFHEQSLEGLSRPSSEIACLGWTKIKGEDVCVLDR